jgi:GT2 family glycosyltransferase
MKIAIGSIVRDGESYVDRHADQIAALAAAAPEHSFHPIIVEGDSKDATYERLRARFNGAVSQASHGGPAFGSVGDPARFRQSSWTWEHVLARIDASFDVFVYIEADLRWVPGAILALMGHLERPEVDVVAPMCIYQGRHYDSWGLRGIDGVCFGPNFPFHYCLIEKSQTGLYPINSAGSCLVMKAEVARTAHFDPPEEAVVGFCSNARKLGWSLWLDPKTWVEHP